MIYEKGEKNSASGSKLLGAETARSLHVSTFWKNESATGISKTSGSLGFLTC